MYTVIYLTTGLGFQVLTFQDFEAALGFFESRQKDWFLAAYMYDRDGNVVYKREGNEKCPVFIKSVVFAA